MLVDLLSTDNYASFNIKIANIMGLHAAIYINELINIERKAVKKDRIVDGYIVVDRNYVKQRTTLITDEQLTIDKKLSSIGVLVIDESSPDKLRLNVDVLTNIIAEDDAQLLGKVSKLTAVKSITTPSTKMSIKQRNIIEFKNSLQCNNEELLEAYKGWIDGVYANPKGFLSARAISLFQKGVDDFAQGDLDLALKIIDIATINGYRNVDWAINVFQKDYAKAFYARYPRVETTPVPKRVSLSDEVF